MINAASRRLDVHPAIERLRQGVARYVDRLGNLGAMATISFGGVPDIQVAAGHADRERTIALSPQHYYQIGSQTKTMTVLAALLLEASGQLRMTDAVARYLHVGVEPAITLEMLAMNSSGLGEYADLVLNPSFPGDVTVSPDMLVKMALLKGRCFEPGRHFDYSNVACVLLGLVVERVAGMPLAQFVRTRILEPLGLTEFYFGAVESQPHEQMARGYLVSKTSGGPIDMSRVSLSWAFATGDLVTSMASMVAFGRALLDRNNAIGLHLEQLTKRVVCAPRCPNSPLSLGAEYAFGLERSWWAGRAVWGHRGGTVGYNTGTWIDPELDIVVTTCITTVRDFMEPEALAATRYPGPQFFTLALATAYAMFDEWTFRGLSGRPVAR